MFFLDCSREKLEANSKKDKMEVFKEPKGICVLKYGCGKYKKRNAVEYPELSNATQEFLSILR